MQNPILDEVFNLVAAGLSIIPIKADGTKAPALGSWKPYQQEMATEGEFRGWFKGNDAGIGVVCGEVSGGLEVIDFDDLSLFAPWCELVDAAIPGLLGRLPKVKTPAGYHCYLRSEHCEGNQKLAQALENGRPKTSIETRGAGGYVVAPPSPAQCHPSGKTYELTYGSLKEIPFISKEERQVLLDSARSFNRYVKPEKVISGHSTEKSSSDDRPGDDYNKRASWPEVLEPHGWIPIFSQGEKTYWRRPGKEGPGCSATTNYNESGLLYVFSSNATPFDSESAYNRFSAFAMLEHHGDFAAAAKALSRDGYGKQNGEAPPWPDDSDAPRNGSQQGEDKPPFGVVVTGTELMQRELSRPPVVVEGWGIRQGGKVMLVGVGGKGKSTLFIQLANQLVVGQPLFGQADLVVAGEQRVLLYMAEDPTSETEWRRRKQLEELDLGETANDGFAIFETREKMLLTKPYHRQALFDAIRQHRATIVMLDPFVALHDWEENSNPEMRAVLDLLTPIQDETGCVFVIAHHEPKTVDGNYGAARGAGAIRDWCRTMLRLTSHGTDNAETSRYTLALDKSNYGGRVRNITLERQWDSYIFSVAKDEGAVTPLMVWEIIGQGQKWYSDVKADIMGQYNVADTTARRVIDKTVEMSLAVMGDAKNEETGRRRQTVARGPGKAETCD